MQMQKTIAELIKVPSNSSLQAIVELVDRAWDLRDDSTHQALALNQMALAQVQSLTIEDKATKTLQAYILKAIGYLHKSLGSYNLGLIHAFKSLDLCRELQLTEAYIINLQTLGWCYTQLNNFPEGLKPFLEALELCQQKEFTYLKASTLLGLSTLYYYMESYEKALQFEEEALKLYSNLENTVEVLTLLSNLAQTHFKLGHYDFALKYAQQNLKLSQELQKFDVQGNALNTLGLIYHEKKNFGEALSYFQGALSRFQAADQVQKEAEVILNISKIYWQKEEIDEALHYCHKALETATKKGNKLNVLNCHKQLVKIYKKLEDFQKALFHYEQYNHISKEIFNEQADNKLKSLQIFHDTERAKQQAEIYRLQNVELKETKDMLEHSLKELESLHKQLKETSIRDGLTQLYNRRYLDEQLDVFFARANRYNQPLSIAIIDIDNFKRINDDFSHQIGDDLLKQVAKLLKADLRGSDLAARYGGEEFVIVFPETPLPQALIVCERTRNKIASYNWSIIHPDICVTISIGLAEKASAQNYQEQLNIADKRLYIAKQRGKNQVIAVS